MFATLWSRNLKRNNDSEGLCVVGIILKEILRKYGVICVLDSS
jgi:hypothetical protein